MSPYGGFRRVLIRTFNPRMLRALPESYLSIQLFETFTNRVCRYVNPDISSWEVFWDGNRSEGTHSASSAGELGVGQVACERSAISPTGGW